MGNKRRVDLFVYIAHIWYSCMSSELCQALDMHKIMNSRLSTEWGKGTQRARKNSDRNRQRVRVFPTGDLISLLNKQNRGDVIIACSSDSLILQTGTNGASS